MHALSKTWDLFNELKNMPVKSALSKMRSRIDASFFVDTFNDAIASFEPHRRTWRGLRVYATDGDQFELPFSEDFLEQGYDGHACPDEMKTYYPRMYVVNCYDVLSGVTKAFLTSKKNEEVEGAVFLASLMDSDSLTLYDRLFFGKRLIQAHQKSNSYFLARVRSGNHFTEVMQAYESPDTYSCFYFEGVQIHILKLKNPRTGESAVYCTNLPRDRFKNKEIADLYALRWEVETSNRDLSETLKVEQWHSKSENGIMQELYACLWLMNQARIQMSLKLRKKCELKNLFNYSKSNFKLIVDFISTNLKDLVEKRTARVDKRLRFLIKLSREKRKRRSRSYPRQTKKARNLYPSASLIPREVK